MVITDLQNGDVILFRGSSLIARAVRWFTRFHYNHSGVFIDGKVYESLQGGIVGSDINQAFANQESYAVLRAIDEQKKEIAIDKIRFFLRQFNGYDYVNLLLLQPIYQLTGLWVGWQSQRRYTCTELIARAYDLRGKNPEQVTAKDLYFSKEFVLQK